MINDLAKKLLQAIKQVDKTTTGYDTAATVKRIEGDTAWVHIPGGVDETPVKLTINASEGDTVQVRVNGGRAWLQGNATSPPTDDTTANVARTIATDAQEEAVRAGKAADAAEAEAVRAGAAADRAEESASDALTAAQSAQTSADSALVSLATVEDVAGVLEWITNHGTMIPTSDVTVNPSHVYFVVNSGGDYVVGNTHYSIVSEPKDSELSTYYELSVDKSIQNYVATHVVVDSEGLWLIPEGTTTTGGNKVLIATGGSGHAYPTAGTYIIGKVNNVDRVYAQFLANGATITSGNNTQIAHLGYGEGNDGGSVSNAPYYTLGLRSAAYDNYSASETYEIGQTCLYNGKGYICVVNITTPEAWNSDHWQLLIGNYSTVNGYGATASGYVSYAEGEDTIATGDYAHSEGFLTRAMGNYSHAEGDSTMASGSWSHAEGEYTVASGDCSHAEGTYTTASGANTHTSGQGTVAGYDNQTVIGKYNKNSQNNVFEVGWGTGDSASQRKNVFSVTKDGNAFVDDYLSVGGDLSVGGGMNLTGDAIIDGNVDIAAGSHYMIDGTQIDVSEVLNAVPDSLTINNHRLVSDIVITADDVGALSTSGGTLTGSLKVNNHSSAIGTVKVKYASAKSVSSGTNTNLTSISLEAGTWVITGGVRFPNNATGYRRMNISTSNASGWADVQLPALNGASTQLAYTVIVSPTATTTYYLNCYHNAGSALSLVAGGSENGINFLRAVRIA